MKKLFRFLYNWWHNRYQKCGKRMVDWRGVDTCTKCNLI